MRRLIVTLLLCSSLPIHAASLSLQAGQLLLDGQPLSAAHSSREALLTPDGRHVVSVGTAPAGEGIWLLPVDGSMARLLLAARADDEPQRNLTDFSSLAFSPDGRELYFLTSAWVTSGALHRIALDGGQPEYLSDANDLRVIASGEHAGKLLVQRHRYLEGGGSHEVWFLLDATGRELQELGDDERVPERWLR